MSEKKKISVLDRLSHAVIHGLENGFEKWGFFVASNPWKVILVSVGIVILCGAGLSQYKEETRGEKIFFPQGSVYLKDKEWLKENFPRNVRPQIHLWEKGGENVLTKDMLLQILDAHETIVQSKSDNLTWYSQCYRIPIANIFITKRKRRRRQVETNTVSEPQESWGDYDLDDYDDFYNEPENVFEDVFTKDDDDDTNKEIINNLPPNIYCDLVNTLKEKCLESSILEIWKFNRDRINQLSQQDIINAVNRFLESPEYGFKFNYTDLLGSMKYNSSGHVVGAQAITNIFFVERNKDLPLEDPGGGAELEHADAHTLSWELAYLNDSFQLQKKAEEAGYKLYVLAGRSYNDITKESLENDVSKLGAGYLLMFIFTVFMLGKVNMVEIRFLLTIAGFFSIIMGIIIAYGLIFAVGFPFTSMLKVLPFLCLGIGIDDMFVILQCWHNLPKDSDKSLAEKIGLTMRHAGVAITVTSVTDVCAFAIGMATIIPGLQGFCFGCAIGISSIFILQLSWFIAWLSMDNARIEKRKNGIVPCCYQHKNWTPSKFSQMEIGKTVLKRFGNFITSFIGRICIFAVTILLAAFGMWGCITMPTEFDLLLFLPQGTYLSNFFFANDRHFPLDGVKVGVYTGAMNDPQQDIFRLEHLTNEIEALVKKGEVLKDYESWWTEYKEYMKKYKGFENWKDTIVGENSNFSMHLSNFLFSPSGAKYKRNFQFEKDLVCDTPASDILASSFSVTYRKFDGPTEHIPGRAALDNLIANANFSSKAFSFDKEYAEWEIDTVIGFELWRNLALAMAAVFLVTLILLAHIQICLIVLLCVLLTMMNMIGFINFAGLTIDTVSCICFILSIGLSVDYSAHIAHAFMINKGSKAERATASLVEIGPAVLNGGITTFLAIIFLGFSLTHVFKTFFLVFSMAVLFGLFHGLAFLPAFLSLLGPSKPNDDESVNPDKITKNLKGEDNNGYPL